MWIRLHDFTFVSFNQFKWRIKVTFGWLCLQIENMHPVTRKPVFCLCETKGAYQLRSDCEADQRLCFRNMDSTIPSLRVSKISRFPFSCISRFVSDLVGSLEDRFCRVAAHNLFRYSISMHLGVVWFSKRLDSI